MHRNFCLKEAVLLLALLALAGVAAAESNVVQIYVHPGSGTVCLDSQCDVNSGSLNTISSTQFTGVPGGQYHLIRVYDTAGYEDYSDQIYMDYNGDWVTRNIYLDPVSTSSPTGPDTGTLRVAIVPGSAEVCLDNRECHAGGGPASGSGTTDFTDVDIGTSHMLTASADGYKDGSAGVTVTKDEVYEVDMNLEALTTATPSESLVPSPLPSATSQPTRAGLSVLTPLAGIGMFGTLFLIRKKG